MATNPGWTPLADIYAKAAATADTLNTMRQKQQEQADMEAMNTAWNSTTGGLRERVDAALKAGGRSLSIGQRTQLEQIVAQQEEAAKKRETSGKQAAAQTALLGENVATALGVEGGAGVIAEGLKVGKKDDGFTLGEGQIRYDAKGNPIAFGPAKSETDKAAGDAPKYREFVNPETGLKEYEEWDKSTRAWVPTGKASQVPLGVRGSASPRQIALEAKANRTPAEQKELEYLNNQLASQKELKFPWSETDANGTKRTGFNVYHRQPDGSLLHVGREETGVSVVRDVSEPRRNAAATKALQHAEMADRVDVLRLSADPRYFEYLTQGQEYLNRVFGRVDSPEAKKFDSEYREFHNQLNQVFNTYRMQVTGMAAAVAELDELKKSFLSSKMSYNEFVANAEAISRVARTNAEINERISNNEDVTLDEQKRMRWDAYLGAKLHRKDGTPITYQDAIDSAKAAGTTTEKWIQNKLKQIRGQ